MQNLLVRIVVMFHSTATSKGQTTIPGRIRKALNMRSGARLEYSLHQDHVLMRVHPGLQSLAGSLASDKGADMSSAKIRRSAARNAVRDILQLL